MIYENEFLREFSPVFAGIVNGLGLSMRQAELEILDEEETGRCYFEVLELVDVLEQITSELNYLTIYTQRPAYFEAFKETLYEENGLLVNLFAKEQLLERSCAKRNIAMTEKNTRRRILLDFERQGECYMRLLCAGYYYIPVYKKGWYRQKKGKDCTEKAGNLDILVPIGYNTLTVKSVYCEKNKVCPDRFEAAFYGNEIIKWQA